VVVRRFAPASPSHCQRPEFACSLTASLTDAPRATTFPMTDAGVTPPVLQTQALGLCFGPRLILAGLDLSLPAHGVDVLMGPVRSGKSVLVRALAGRHQDDPNCRQWGLVSMAGHPLANGWRPTLVQQQARVAQVSLREALALPAQGQRRHTAPAGYASLDDALRHHGLAALAKDLDEPVARLTPSRQRAVNILGHALVGAPLLMVDEPTYGLADGEALWLVAWLTALGRRVRLLVVLQHHGHARRLADRIVLLGGGRVLAHESAARFFSQPPNAYADQFVRTGEISIAAPDANPDHLPPGVETPPSLPTSVWATLLEMRAKSRAGAPAAPSERLLRDFHTQPGELADSQLADLTHSQRADLDPAPPRAPELPKISPTTSPTIPSPAHAPNLTASASAPAARAKAPAAMRPAAPPAFPAHRLSGADFSDTIPGARLDMMPLMPPRATLGSQDLRPRSPPARQPGTDRAAAPPEATADASPPAAPPAAFTPSEASKASAPPAAPGPGPQRWASLPPVSQTGADDAAAVGRVILVDHRGPAGFHWLVPGKLAGCAEPGAVMAVDHDLELLARAGVHTLITLTERDLDPAALARHRLTNLHLPILDRQAPTIAQAYMLASRIQRLMDHDLTVAVHCKAGIGRTGVVLAAWMIREGSYSADGALRRLRRVNPAYVQTQEQEAFLLAFEQDLRRRSR
jgi:ABC-type phosphate transport system ATPase subunit